jgi:2',3'-cyclic-nucleotide 2'-phosphodiesterase (5'-nucleotidase family)
MLGTYVAEAVRKAVGADIGIINCSGLRKDIQAGYITKMNVYEMIPFRNFISYFSIHGSDLKKIITDYVGSLKNKHTLLNFSNVRCTWKRDGEDYRVMSLYIGSDKIDDGKLYSCATLDYLIDQSERYFGFVPSDVVTSDKLLLDVVVTQIEQDHILGNFNAPGFSEN